MRSIPLRLETYYVDESRTKALPQYRAPDVSDIFEAVSCAPLIDAHPDTPNRFRVRVEISVTPTTNALAPYEAFIRIVGFFRVTDPGAPMEAKRQMVHGAAVSMLYSAARDHLYTITAKGPNEPLILPAVTIPVPGDRTAQFWGPAAEDA